MNPLHEEIRQEYLGRFATLANAFLAEAIPFAVFTRRFPGASVLGTAAFKLSKAAEGLYRHIAEGEVLGIPAPELPEAKPGVRPLLAAALGYGGACRKAEEACKTLEVPEVDWWTDRIWAATAEVGNRWEAMVDAALEAFGEGKPL
jgi:hypothetical protein